ncbi:MAG: AmmeMemoRadiSam system protein B [Acidobacteria bacterium]|uniref:MEMO1 family protein IFK94_08455 n=1 Tax=Candidatus Polarisedimenticola svalbardensis TaxID=2886004 RepID=A0A8J7CLI7_9BACT|nr:AmmeMemoRadiSam system protein B [Candidatus Polarisedimenticola svalbardensis]
MIHSLGPNLAGTWYPADRDELQSEVRRMLATEGDPDAGADPVIALIEPHAGYAYSGQVAAAGFRQVRGERFRRVIMLGPSHHEYFKGAAIPMAAGYNTPMGTVPLDTEVLGDLAGKTGFLPGNTAFEKEHCLEIELPFLQEALAPGWKLVPVLLGHDLPEDMATQVAAGLQHWYDSGTLLVASSDLTHFGHSFQYVPFKDDLPERIRDLDMGALDRILAGDREGFRSYVTRTGATICGRNAIDILMRMVPGSAQAELLRYDSSGNMTSDWKHSVSYAALAFRASGIDSNPGVPDDDHALRPGDRNWLLNLAREAIRSTLDRTEEPQGPPEDCPPILLANRATFVTLQAPGPGGYRLRGCIGNMTPRHPLYRSVMDNACKSAFSDPRFDALERKELDRVRIEISVLSPMQPVDDPETIVPGRDGVQLASGSRVAVFLPQVAKEQGWDREELLDNLSLKAGLKKGSWKQSRLSAFQATVFGEEPDDGAA